MIDYLRHAGIPVFHAFGIENDDEFTYWDSNSFPDWRQFVDVAKESGARLMLLATETFDESDLDLGFEKLEECEISADGRREFTRQFETLRKHVGQTAWVRLAFDHSGQWLACEFIAPWHDDYELAMEELNSFIPLDFDEEELGDSDRGFFSHN